MRSLVVFTSTPAYISMIYVQISGRNLDHVRKLKSSMTRLTSRVQKVLCILVLLVLRNMCKVLARGLKE